MSRLVGFLFRYYKKYRYIFSYFSIRNLQIYIRVKNLHKLSSTFYHFSINPHPLFHRHTRAPQHHSTNLSIHYPNNSLIIIHFPFLCETSRVPIKAGLFCVVFIFVMSQTLVFFKRSREQECLSAHSQTKTLEHSFLTKWSWERARSPRECLSVVAVSQAETPPLTHSTVGSHRERTRVSALCGAVI